MSKKKFSIVIATTEHISYAQAICTLIEDSAKKRGTGIAKRDPNYIKEKIEQGKAIIAFDDEGVLAGFCYIETWEGKEYVANSGLIVAEQFRNARLASSIKKKAFEYTRLKYPDAKIFGITTSLAVMKINSDLGYKPVTFSELTQDDTFWSGCKSCVNFDVLTRTDRKMCICTGMLYDPKEDKRKIFVDTIKNSTKKIPHKLKTPKAKRFKKS